MNTEFFNNGSSMTYDYLVGYEVLSKTHRLLTQDLIMAQQGLIDNTMSGLLTILLAWVLIMSAFSFLYGAPVMQRFIDEINEIKNILSILPISVARELPLAPKYFNKIIDSHHCCWRNDQPTKWYFILLFVKIIICIKIRGINIFINQNWLVGSAFLSHHIFTS